MNRGSAYPREHVAFLKEECGFANIICQKCEKDQASTNCVLLFCGTCCKDKSDGVFCPRHHLRRPLKAPREVKYSTKLKQLPPWLEYPNVARYEIWWRMGPSEDYWHSFWAEFRNLTPKEQKWYQQDFPEPPGWTGVYMDMINADLTDEPASNGQIDDQPADASQSSDPL